MNEVTDTSESVYDIHCAMANRCARFPTFSVFSLLHQQRENRSKRFYAVTRRLACISSMSEREKFNFMNEFFYAERRK